MIRRAGGIVLCGGLSSRMGRPKAWLPFGAELMLPRIVRLLRTVVEPVAVVAAVGQALPPLPTEVRVVHDEVDGRGPLQGLAAGLKALRDEVDVVYLSSCDVPLLEPEFVRRLLALLGANLICVPRIDGYYQPLAAVYRVEVLTEIDRLLDAGRLRPLDLFDLMPTRTVATAELVDVDPTLETLRNLNTPAEYARAVSEFEQSKR